MHTEEWMGGSELESDTLVTRIPGRLGTGVVISRGDIPQGTPATYTFTFENTGKTPLIITNASASCGCTTPDWSKEPIKPGKKGFVKATYNAAAPGPFTKSVTVMSNATNSTIILYLKGDVKPTEQK
jgi:archaellum component FlaG (FlaF/FlaG flagellin family)